jgi:UTP:GlnB (protein PII) uridylyltransferase
LEFIFPPIPLVFQKYCLTLQSKECEAAHARQKSISIMERAQVIESIREVAKKTLPPRSTLLLYGSRARGEEHQGSDWDLLILLDKAELSDNDYDNVSFPFTMLGWNIGELISPQLYTKNEWASISFLPFYKNVEHDKIELYES